MGTVLYRAHRTFVSWDALHFVPSGSVHANVISTYIEAFMHAAIAARKLFSPIILRLMKFSLYRCSQLNWD